jgi:putative sporulation protein YtaF
MRLKSLWRFILGDFAVVCRESSLLALALSIDALAAAFAYGNRKVKIPLSFVFVVSVVCSSLLAVSLCFGKLLKGLMSPTFSQGLCFAIFMILGLLKLFEFAIKALIRKNRELHSSIGFSFASLHFILDIYADPMEADRDASNSLSLGEAIALAVALSLDGLVAGFGYSVSGEGIIPVVLISFVFGFIALKAGEILGRRLATRSSFDLSFVSGIILIVLAFFKLN